MLFVSTKIFVFVDFNFSYFSSLFEHFFSFVFFIFASCGMGTSRGRHQQSSFPVFLQMQPCISGKSNLLFFSNTIRSFDHQMSAFVIDIYMCPACNVHSKSTKKRSSFVPFEVGAEWNFGNNLIVMQICKDNKMTTTKHFFNKKFSILPVSEEPFERKPEDATLEGLAIMKMQLKVNKHFNIKPTLKKTVFGFLKQSALKSFPFSLLIFLSM